MPRGIDPRDSAYLQGRLWTPAVLRPAAWWNAADLSTISHSGGTISQWRDSSGNGRHASGGTATLQTQNGLNACYFSGTGPMSISSAGNQKISIIAAVTPGTNTGGTGYKGICANESGGSMLLARTNNLAWGTFGGGPEPSTGTILSDNGLKYILVIDGLSSGSFFENGSAVGTYTATQGQSPAHLGGISTQAFVGQILEVLWFGVEMSRPRRLALEGYLSHKWAIGLTADHPFVNRPPLIGD